MANDETFIVWFSLGGEKMQQRGGPSALNLGKNNEDDETMKRRGGLSALNLGKNMSWTVCL
jgi:hypothetical protein